LEEQQGKGRTSRKNIGPFSGRGFFNIAADDIETVDQLWGNFLSFSDFP